MCLTSRYRCPFFCVMVLRLLTILLQGTRTRDPYQRIRLSRDNRHCNSKLSLACPILWSVSNSGRPEFVVDYQVTKSTPASWTQGTQKDQSARANRLGRQGWEMAYHQAFWLPPAVLFSCHPKHTDCRSRFIVDSELAFHSHSILWPAYSWVE